MTSPSPLFDWRQPLVWIALMSGSLLLLLLAFLAGASPLFALLPGAAVVALVLLYRAPLVLLSSLIIVRMSLDYSAQYVSVTLFDITLSLSQLVGAGIACLGACLIVWKRRALSNFPLLLPFLIVFSWGLFTLTYSIDPRATLTELIRVFDLFAIGALAYVSVTRYRDFRTLLHAIFLSSILPILFGFYQFAGGIGLQDENVSIPRIFGTFSHPNVYSLFLFATIALATLYAIIYAKTREAKLLIASYLVLLVTTLILTYARIAWIALFVFLGLLALWRARFLLAPLILFPLILIAFSATVQDRVLEAINPTPDSSITWRQNLWHDMRLKTRLEDRQWLGSGMDTFRVSSEALRGTRFGSNDPHNDFVKFYVEGGYLGILVLLATLGCFIGLIVRIYRETPSHSLRTLATLTGFVIATLLLASLSDNVWKNTPVQWLLWALLGGLLAIERESKKKSLAS